MPYGGDVLEMMWGYVDPNGGSFAKRMSDAGISKEDFKVGMTHFADTLRYLETGNRKNRSGRNISAEGGFRDKEGKYGAKGNYVNYEDTPDHARGYYQFKPSAVDTAMNRTSSFWNKLTDGKGDAEAEFEWMKERGNKDFHKKMSDSQQREMMLINVFMQDGSWNSIENYLTNPTPESLVDLYDKHHYKAEGLDIANVLGREADYRGGQIMGAFNAAENRLANISNDPRAVETLAGRPIREAEERALRQRARKN